MKNASQTLILLTVFAFACNGPNTSENPKDSTQPAVVHDEATTGGNVIKTEAPDAVSKTEQGYALPYDNKNLVQSPINILSNSTSRDTDPIISIAFKTEVTAVRNLSHTVQLDFKDGSTTLVNSKVYTPKQFHFHTPSEHLLDGMTYPMEMHIVNVLKDSNANNNPQFLVIALLFKMGQENKFIQEFLKSIPMEEGKDTLQQGTVNLEDLFSTIPKKEPDGYYSYKGSLTTPPFSETVTWVVKKHIFEASPEQILAIEKLEGDNARHVQAIYTRKVLTY